MLKICGGGAAYGLVRCFALVESRNFIQAFFGSSVPHPRPFFVKLTRLMDLLIMDPRPFRAKKLTLARKPSRITSGRNFSLEVFRSWRMGFRGSWAHLGRG